MWILVPDCHLLGRSRLYLGVFVFKLILITLIITIILTSSFSPWGPEELILLKQL